MRLLGFNISRSKSLEKALSSVNDGGRGWHTVFERFPGAWQQNVEVKFDSVLSNHADFTCRTLIASDIAKLRIKLVQKTDSGIWTEVSNSAYSPVLRKPNHFQNRMQFVESWVLSKLQTGNTYVLKQRDNRGVVTKLYVLDPRLVTPLVSETGDVFYQLNTDHLAGLDEGVVVPARDIIHDRYNCFYHPLVGLSPIFAGGLAAMQGLAIQNDSASFFRNGARPGGVLTAPGAIEDATATRIKDYWDKNFAGENSGKVAVLGDGLKYEAMRAKSTDSQLLEQLQWSAKVICSTYHVPPYKAGIGDMPAFNNIQALNVEYYSQCLQTLIEAMELCLDEGLGMADNIGTELDTENLLRMDALTQMDVLDKGKNIFTPDEARARLSLGPTPGGSVVYRQQQDFSLEALAKRDAQPDPFGTAPAAKPEPVAEPANDNATELEAAKALSEIHKGFSS